jgi:site-specific recombinase XerD
MINYRQYLELIGYKASTIQTLQYIAGEYLNYVTQKPCTISDYLHYLAQRKNKNNPAKNLSNKHLNLHIYGLKKYFNYLEKVENKTITASFLNYKTTQKPIEYLTLEEIKQLFQATIHNPQWHYRDQTILACLYHLGLRVGEACHLKVEDIHLETNILLVRTSKTGYPRQLPIAAHARMIFENYLENSDLQPNDYFLQGVNKKLNKQVISRVLAKLKVKTNIQKRIYPHLLRHSIATQLLQNGMEIEKISQFLGHRSLESTQIYTHIIGEL